MLTSHYFYHLNHLILPPTRRTILLMVIPPMLRRAALQTQLAILPLHLTLQYSAMVIKCPHRHPAMELDMERHLLVRICTAHHNTSPQIMLRRCIPSPNILRNTLHNTLHHNIPHRSINNTRTAQAKDIITVPKVHMIQAAVLVNNS